MKRITTIITLISVYSLINLAQTSYNSTILSRWNTTSGPVNTIDSQGDTVFFNTGFTLNIVDFSQSLNPVLLYQYNYFSTIEKIRHYDKYIVIHLNNGLKILNVENPNNVTEVWDLPDASIRDFLLYESNDVVYLYLLYSSFFKTVIITNPSSPLQIVNFPLSFNVWDISITNNRLCLLTSQSSWFIDVSDPYNPIVCSEQLAGGCPLGNGGPNGRYILAYNNFVYASYHYYCETLGQTYEFDGLDIIDINDPYSPIVVTYQYSDLWINCIFNDNKAYVVNGDFEIYDVTNPASIYKIAELGTSGNSADICLSIDHVYIADGNNGVIKVNISASPEIVGHYQNVDEPTAIYDVKYFGNYAYLLDAGAEKLRIVDVSNPFYPVQTGNIATTINTLYAGYHFDVAVGTAFIVDNENENYFVIHSIDVTDPYNPVSIGDTYLERNGADVIDANICGNHLFICRSNSFYIIDISDPYNLVVNSHVYPAKGARHSFADQNYLYIVSWRTMNDGLYIYDISDPVNPVELSFLELVAQDESSDIEMNQNVVFISYWNNTRLTIVDASTPTNPQEISTYTSFHGSPWNIKITYPYLYLVDYAWGTEIYDITNPQAIEEVGLYKNQYTLRCDAYSNKIYAADSYLGMTIVQNDLITSVEIGNSMPEKLCLTQNYPNPFNPSTRIKYSVNSTQNLTLKVYDLLGREITTLVNEEKQPGTYEVEFNADGHSGEVRNLTSGVYFYQLRAGEFVETKKMVLMK